MNSLNEFKTYLIVNYFLLTGEDKEKDHSNKMKLSNDQGISLSVEKCQVHQKQQTQQQQTQPQLAQSEANLAKGQNMTLYCCSRCKIGAPCLCKELLPYREIPDTNDTKVLLNNHDDDDADQIDGSCEMKRNDVKSQNGNYEIMRGLSSIDVKHHSKQSNPIQNNENGDIRTNNEDAITNNEDLNMNGEDRNMNDDQIDNTLKSDNHNTSTSKKESGERMCPVRDTPDGCEDGNDEKPKKTPRKKKPIPLPRKKTSKAKIYQN